MGGRGSEASNLQAVRGSSISPTLLHEWDIVDLGPDGVLHQAAQKFVFAWSCKHTAQTLVEPCQQLVVMSVQSLFIRFAELVASSNDPYRITDCGIGRVATITSSNLTCSRAKFERVVLVEGTRNRRD